MTTSDEPILLDTNVLVYAADRTSPHHEASRHLRDSGRQGLFVPCLTPQILFEFYAVLTDARRVNQPLTARAIRSGRAARSSPQTRDLAASYNGHLHDHRAKKGRRMPRTMSAAEFKAKCLEVLDQVAARHEVVVVTKRGTPVAQVTPIVRRPTHL